MDCSPLLQKYFESLDKEAGQIYEIANKARSQNLDPESKVDIPVARNLAERVEGLVSAVAPEIVGKGIPKRIIELEKEHSAGDWRVGLIISKEVAQGKFCKFDSKIKGMEIGVRVGLAYLTLGVVSAPLEGFIELKERLDNDNINFKWTGSQIGKRNGLAMEAVRDFIRFVRVATCDIYRTRPLPIQYEDSRLGNAARAKYKRRLAFGFEPGITQRVHDPDGVGVITFEFIAGAYDRIDGSDDVGPFG